MHSLVAKVLLAKKLLLPQWLYCRGFCVQRTQFENDFLTLFCISFQKTQENKEKTCSELNCTLSSLKEELQKKESLLYELKNKHKQQRQELEAKVSSKTAIIELNNQQVSYNKHII